MERGYRVSRAIFGWDNKRLNARTKDSERYYYRFAGPVENRTQGVRRDYIKKEVLRKVIRKALRSLSLLVKVHCIFASYFLVVHQEWLCFEYCQFYPYNFWWCAFNDAEFLEIWVFCYDNKIVSFRKLPDFQISCWFQAHQSNLSWARVMWF